MLSLNKGKTALIGVGLIGLGLIGLWLYAQTSYTVTWTSQTHFENNGAPDSNYTGAITSTNIDTTSSPGNIKLASGIYWIQRSPTNSPPARHFATAAYDVQRQKSVLFGGRISQGNNFQDTWEWDGTNWTQMDPTTKPSARHFGGCIAYDEARQKTILFGGYDGTQALQETWAWDGTNWTPLSPATSPPINYAYGMVYDSDLARQKIVFFGGYNGLSTWYNDTWEWNGTTWTQVFPTTSPSKRSSFGMVYDSARQKIVLFGGYYPSSSSLDDTWEYDGTTWTQMNPTITPAASSHHGMVYDSARGKTVLFGCASNSETTWEWDGTNWTQINTGSVPPARDWCNAQLVYDSIRGKVVLFGGLKGTTNFDDTWEYPFSYPSSGTITNLKINGQDDVCNWETISWNATITTGTSVMFRTRGADTEAGLASAGWSSYYETSGAIITTPNSRWLEIAALLTSDSTDTPIVHDFSITYSHNEEIAASTTNGQSPLNVDFSTTLGTNGTVVQYEWDFDYDNVTFRPDFTSNLTGDANFTYELAGIYTARLRVTYADGTIIERTVEITVSAPGDAPSITGINTATTTGPAPLTITFTMIAAPGIGQIEAYFWDFDGDEVIDFTSTTTNTALYTYTKEGNYTVTGKVQDSEGMMAKDDLTITVTAPVSTPPTANIITPTNPTTITVGESILFEGSGITKADGSIVKYEWDLDGDGSIDYGSTITATTSYIYLQTGTVTVTLRVTEEPSGLTGEDTVTITVEPSPVPRVAIKQPGIPVSGKDGLRRTVKGKITVKAVSVPIPATQTLDLRYRHVGDVDALPDTFTSPADDPPEPQDAAWQTTVLDKSTFNTADAGAEGFITRLDTSGLLDDNWYEIIAIANYNPGTGTYDAWNAGQIHKRVFIYIEPTNPELDEDENRQKTRVKKDKCNEANRKGEVDVILPYDGVTTDTDLTIGTPGSIPLMGGLDFINNYKEITLSNNAKLCKPAKIKITYSDTDDDDTVDGTTIPETTLIVYRYDEMDGKWEPLPGQIIDRHNNIINANAPAFSIFGMAGTPAYTGGTSTGSSGHEAWYKPWSACGLLGLEAILFIFILIRLRRKTT